MVSLNTILAVGGVAAAYFIFQNLGGASGIGSRIGGGFSDFGTSLSASLNPLKTAFGQNPQYDQTYENYLEGKRTPNTLPFDENPSFVIKDEEKDMKEEESTPFDFGKFLDTLPRFIPSIPSATAQESTFAGKGMISKGYQEPNYNKPSAGYTSSNFFGGNPNTYVNPWSRR